MKALIISEYRKLRSTRTALWIGVAMMGLAAANAFIAQSGEFPFDRPLDNPLFRSLPTFFGVLILILGLRSSTDEFRYGTITPTLLTTPRRARTFAAKLAVVGAAGLVLAVVTEAFGIVLNSILAAGRGGSVAIDGALVTRLIGGAAGFGLIMAIVGVALGWLLRNQVAAVAGGLVWFLFLDEALSGPLKESGGYLPAQSAYGLTSVGRPHLLEPLAGGAVFAVYAIAVALVAVAAMRRRDIA